LHIPLSQKEIVERCPKEFNKGKYEEGSINSYFLLKDQIVSNEFDIKCKVLPPDNINLNKNETLFLFVKWKNNPSDNHCIRFCHKTISYIYFMNPTYGKIERCDIKTLCSWVTIPILITKN